MLTDLLLLSGPTIHHLVSSSLPELGDIHALRDDELDIDALWRAAGRVGEPAAADAACDEKLAALQGIEHLRRLFEHVVMEFPNRAQAREVANTLTYYNSFAGTIAHVFCGFVRYLQWERGGKANAKPAGHGDRSPGACAGALAASHAAARDPAGGAQRLP